MNKRQRKKHDRKVFSEIKNELKKRQGMPKPDRYFFDADDEKQVKIYELLKSMVESPDELEDALLRMI